MKMFLTSLFAVLLVAAVSTSCSTGNYGHDTGNVAVNLGGMPMPGIAIGGGGGPRGYAPPPGLRPFKGVPPQCRVINQGGHRIVCDPRGRQIGFLPPQGYGQPSYAGSGGGYRPQPGGYGGGSNYPRPRSGYDHNGLPPGRPTPGSYAGMGSAGLPMYWGPFGDGPYYR